MTVLEERWPRLSGLPRVSLATLPTPVTRLERLSGETGSDIWIKRDDLTARTYGGNKVRKLEYLLGEARRRGADTIVTMGALGSHHVLATSIYAPSLEIQVEAVLVPQPWNAHVEENLRCVLAAGTRIHPARNLASAAAIVAGLLAKSKMTGRRPYVVPHGGSSPVGAVAYVAAGLELAEQIDTGEAPEPDAIYVALGSGGTLAGLSIGLAAAGITAPVIGVRVTDPILANATWLHTLVRRTVHRLRGLDPAFPDCTRLAIRHLRIDASEVGSGYGSPSEAGEQALKRALESEGLTLDTTYTSRAFAAMLRDAEAGGRRLLYWHTLSSASLEERLRTAPPAPPWARASAQRRDPKGRLSRSSP